MKLILIAFFVCLAFFSFEQKYASIGEKEGEMYYMHKVESNNSFYSISVTYETSIDQLKENNPELSEGLKIGQLIWIPVKYDDFIHIVRHRETLYGISKRYSKPIDTIVAYNPSIKDGLQKGQEIIIKNIIRPIKLASTNDNPFSTHSNIENTSSDFEDSLVEYVVHSGETLYSISRRFMVSIDTLSNRNQLTSNVLSEGQVLIIPLKKELEVKERENQDTLGMVTEIFLDSVSYFENDSIHRNVVVFLPFNLDTVDVRNIRRFAVDYYMAAL
ncbi:MAG: LysM peptidoglycan-binding domain-containing protein, partial [Crocinitomicaceae bacterium]|nr:LysM peptidoglycan-binding domain-containing protein [Crocinitomicaceae bacterium]